MFDCLPKACPKVCIPRAAPAGLLSFVREMEREIGAISHVLYIPTRCREYSAIQTFLLHILRTLYPTLYHNDFPEPKCSRSDSTVVAE